MGYERDGADIVLSEEGLHQMVGDRHSFVRKFVGRDADDVLLKAIRDSGLLSAEGVHSEMRSAEVRTHLRSVGVRRVLVGTPCRKTGGERNPSLLLAL